MTDPRFRAGDVVRAKGSPTLMSIVGRSKVITSEPCWDCTWFRPDMKKATRAFLEANLEPVKPEEPKGAA